MGVAAKRSAGTVRAQTAEVGKPPAIARKPSSKPQRPARLPETGKVIRRTRASRPAEMKTATLHLRLKEGLKEDAAAILAKAGISVPEAIRVFLGRIVSEDRIPFELEVPNPATRRAMAEADRITTARFRTAGELFDDLEKGTAS